MGRWGETKSNLKSKKECELFARNYFYSEGLREKEINFLDLKLRDLDIAKMFIKSSEAEGDAVAVSYYADPEKPKSTKSSKLLTFIESDELPALNKKLTKLFGKLEKSFSDPELEFVNCAECESKVNIRFLNVPPLGMFLSDPEKRVELRCPVCGTSGLEPKVSKAIIDELKKIRQEAVELKHKWRVTKELVREENELEPVWLVKVSTS